MPIIRKGAAHPGGERGTQIDLARQLIDPSNTKLPAHPQDHPILIDVYDGLKIIGQLDDHHHRHIDAFTLGPMGHVKLGTFTDRSSAMRALLKESKR
jgi:hypothetical protein